jgi:hypothetical protein
MSNQQVIPPTSSEQEEMLRERRLARMQRRKQSRRARIILWGTIGSSILLLGVIGFVFWSIQSLLNHDATNPVINGISCDSIMHGTFHIHAHVTIYINGKSVTIPQGVGIAPDGSCFYWIHTHTSDGIIHIEAPQKQSNLALDDFLTIWHNRFANLNFPPEMLQTTGWKIWINGKPFSGVVTSPLQTEVAMNSHNIITLEYGSPNPKPDDASTYHFPANLPK